MRFRHLNLALLFFGFFSNIANATTIKAFSFDELVAQSELIVQARVVQVNQTGSNFGIQTLVVFELNQVIKGNYSQKTLTLRFAGGKRNGRVQKIVGLRYPELNEEGIYFIKSINNPAINPILGWDQGHFLIKLDPATQMPVVHTSRGIKVIS